MISLLKRHFATMKGLVADKDDPDIVLMFRHEVLEASKTVNDLALKHKQAVTTLKGIL